MDSIVKATAGTTTVNNNNIMEARNSVVATPNATERNNAVATASVEQKSGKKTKFSEVAIVADGNERKSAFAKGINRSVNFKNVQSICGYIKTKGYRNAEVIQVVKAEDFLKNGDLSLVDINGATITNENASEYYIVLDGQHRVYAVAEYNQWVKENNENNLATITVPAVIAELEKGETIAEYINEINITKQEWNIADYVQGAANVHADNEFLQTYKKLIKSKENPNGFPISTLNRIFCGIQTAISQKDFSLLCSGITEKGKANKKIIPAYNLEIGEKFISICRDKGFTDKDIAKRFLISEFNDVKHQYSLEKAFEVLNSITPNDKEEMFNTRQNLDEQLVREKIEAIINRLKNNE